MKGLTKIRHAGEVIKNQIVKTPLMYSSVFSKKFHAEIFLKLENMQKTGSFKIRGAAYKINTLREKSELQGVVAASAGNHAQGVALAAANLRIPATIVMPETVSIAKQEAVSAYGGKIVIYGQRVDESLEKANEIASKEGRALIHPYDDPDVIAGQGTVGLEILSELSETDLIIVPVGGGGLISGIASAVKEIRPKCKIVGVQAEGCPSAVKALAQGKPIRIDSLNSIADGINVRQIGRYPYKIIEKLVDEIVLVNEEDIAAALLMLLERKKILTEGAGAIGLAALMNKAVIPTKGSRVVLVISGGNVDSQLLDRIILKGLVKQGRIMNLRIRLDDYPGALATLLSQIAACKANVLKVDHKRNVRSIPLGKAFVDLELETRGPNHIREIMDELKAKGYELTGIS